MSAKGFLELKTIDEALAICKRIATEADRPTERVPLLDALGRVAAADVASSADLPGFDRSAMDGYAVRAEDTFAASADSPVTLRLVGEVRMGQAAGLTVRAGEAAGIGTGGMMPDGADATLMVEYAELLDEQTIVTSRTVAPGENVIRADEDLRTGAVCVQAGTLIRPQQVGLLAAAGATELDVFRRVNVGIISTGDELVDPHESPGPGQIRDINSYALMGLVKEAGAQASFFGIVPDEKGPMIEAARSVSETSDVVLISGGSSVGVRDLTVEVLGELGEPGVLVHGVQMKPGKPTILAVANGTIIVGLPGHPTSSMVCFHVIIAPLLRWLSGCSHEPLPVYARAGRNIPCEEGKTEFIRARVFERHGELWAEPIFGKSGLVSTMAHANALIGIPAGTEGVYEGDLVRARPL